MTAADRIRLIAAGTCLLISISAASRGSDGVFERYDRNKDGKVTADEVPNRALFARFDLDGDGAITPQEYAQVAGTGDAEAQTGARPRDTRDALSTRVDALIRSADKNGDGRITREEAGDPPWFSRLDRNGDGIIGPDELSAVRRALERAGGDAVRGLKGLAANSQPLTRDAIAGIPRGAAILKPGDVGVGRMLGEISCTTLDGRDAGPGASMGKNGLVIAMTSTTCPVSKRYMPGIVRLERELAAQEIGLLLVNPFASEGADAIKARLAEAGITAAYVHDKERKVAGLLRARTTTEVFLLDAARTLVYRGALDDQYGVDYNLDSPRQRYLLDAVEALLRREKPAVEATAAPGCELDLPDNGFPSTAGPVTYHRDVARILQQNCVRCHREGGIAPFALEEMEEVRDRARVIKRVVSEGIMPPWFAALEKDAGTNPWANDCSLSARDKADLIAWLDSRDRPAGSVAEAPLKKSFPSEWSIGKPDLILTLSRAYDIKAEGFMPYAFDVIDTDLPEDVWVAAYEILPSERDVVHHVIVQVHQKGTDTRDRAEGVGGYWAAYVPGNGANSYPQGFARKMPAGARVSFQIHYTPSGKAKKERLRMGLVFAKEPPQYEVRTVAVANPKLSIPPGAPNHIETKSQSVPVDIPVTSFLAHMHIRGKAFTYGVTYPDGREETLLDIPRYDFNWQLRYDLKQPKVIPRGSTLKITAAYDNSSANKANPDPARTVRWGQQTVDEMMIGYMEYFTPVSPPQAAAR